MVVVVVGTHFERSPDRALLSTSLLPTSEKRITDQCYSCSLAHTPLVDVSLVFATQELLIT